LRRGSTTCTDQEPHLHCSDKVHGVGPNPRLQRLCPVANAEGREGCAVGCSSDTIRVAEEPRLGAQHGCHTRQRGHSAGCSSKHCATDEKLGREHFLQRRATCCTRTLADTSCPYHTLTVPHVDCAMCCPCHMLTVPCVALAMCCLRALGRVCEQPPHLWLCTCSVNAHTQPACLSQQQSAPTECSCRVLSSIHMWYTAQH
jgi:hypothetical protein